MHGSGPIRTCPRLSQDCDEEEHPRGGEGVANMKMDNEEPMGEGVASIEISIHVCGKQINLKCMCV